MLAYIPYMDPMNLNVLSCGLWFQKIFPKTRYSAEVLSDDVFYGRAIMKIPRQAGRLDSQLEWVNGGGARYQNRATPIAGYPLWLKIPLKN